MTALARFFTERRIFYLLLLAALTPVWSGRFFVTGDGPCHVYNARVLLDYVLGRDRAFYEPFYNLNTSFDPNWFGHLWLAALQSVLAPETAEKVFLSGYVLLFGLGLRFLLRQINASSIFLSSVGLLFVWHHLLQSGFYNYACSVALFFWVCGYWLKCRHDWTNRRLIILAAGWLVLYSAHPMGLIFSGIFIGCAMLGEWLGVTWQQGWRAGWRQFTVQATHTALAALPMLVLLAGYFYRKPSAPDGNTETIGTAARDLVQLTALVAMNSTERDTVQAVAILVLLLAAGAIWLRKRQWAPGDFIVLFLGIVLWQYFRQAGAQSLELLLPLRIQLFVWLALLCWAATAHFPEWARRAVPGVAVVLLGILLYLRLPTHRKASALVEDYMSCVSSIDDRSVVLVLNYDFNGRDEAGNGIGNRIWLFNHAADYIGAYRAAIMSDNYEALRFYFPFSWNWQRDMFSQTDKDGINFDNRPPRADILSFNRRSGGYNIDYVLVLNYSEPDFDHQYAREIHSQLDLAYDFIYGSPGQRAELYRLKKR